MKKFKIQIVLLLGLIFTFSCEEYLDIAPELEIELKDAFLTFRTSQGFVEEMYNLVTSYDTAGGNTFQDYLYGDDNYQPGLNKFSGLVDIGALDGWFRNRFSYLSLNDINNGPGNSRLRGTAGRPRLWRASLLGIRKANIILENEDLMVSLTEEEKNVILGQAYFFRAFFHNEIMKFWGRFPHIKEVFDGVTPITTVRPDTYKEVALSINEDYKKAIELLPVDWNAESFGGDNALRVTKGAAYAFQGKNLLLAASPLMFFNNEPGIDTYTYDTELANMAADAFAEVLKLQNTGVYSLAQNLIDYRNVLWRSANTFPGVGTELIFAGSAGSRAQRNAFMAAGMPRDVVDIRHQATSIPHSYIHQNFGMANGLSIEDDLSGNFGPTTYNPARPFDNRDPRFYEWIFVDRDLLTTVRNNDPDEFRVVQLFSTDQNGLPGIHRRRNASTTGYLVKKFYPQRPNGFHTEVNRFLGRFSGVRLHMRLTDVYLMYAEALHVAKGPTTPSDSFALTAEQAINILRARANIPAVNSNIVSDNNKFMDEIRRERAVELLWEAHRWVDIRRWGIAHLPKYKIKTELNFDKDWTFFEESFLVERICDYPKHYWLPFEPSQTQIFAGFIQNPGW